MMQMMQPSAKLSIKPLLALPKIAWLTVAMFLSGIALWSAALWLTAHDRISSVALTRGFDCRDVHRLHADARVSARRRRKVALALNEWIGRISSSMFFSPFKAFQLLHLKHHSHVNDVELDPDHWSAKSFLPLRWMTQDIYYYYFYLSNPQQRTGEAGSDRTNHSSDRNRVLSDTSRIRKTRLTGLDLTGQARDDVAFLHL